MQQLTPNTLLHGGTYKIEKVLGQGSFGITYLAEHTALGKKVAIKEFFMKELNSRSDDGSITGMSDGSLSYNYGQKFKKEAINLSRLEHPNIVRVTDSFDENGTYYYVMDYIDGCNLNDYIKGNAISENEAISIIKDIANALIYMHEEKHVLHLDLKPGNIMRRSDGHIFLIDFGLSKHFSNDGQPETSTTIGLGTAGYAPIEQANQAKNGEFRPTIDVYALGATLYKVLTRETPPASAELIEVETMTELLDAKGISKPLSSVICNAMMPSAKKRTQSIRDFVKELQEEEGKPAESSDKTEAKSPSKDKTVDGDETVIMKNESAKEIDKEQIAYDTAELILNQEYDKNDALLYLTSQDGVSENDVEEIMDQVEEMVRQANRDAAKKEIIKGIVYIIAGAFLTALTAGFILFYGAVLWGWYLIFRGIKSFYLGHTYGKKNKYVTYYVLAVIAVIIGVFYLVKGCDNNPDTKEFIEAYNQINGYGVERNEQVGMDRIIKLADASYGPAAYILSSSYSSGLYGLATDSLAANKYWNVVVQNLETEAKQGDKCAQAFLGFMYLNGNGVQQDYTLAEKWLKKAADQEYDFGIFYLGYLYASTRRNTEAFQYIEKVASKDYPPAVNSISYMYANGIGTPLDSTKYASSLIKAADLGDENAQANLGWIYMIGENSFIERNPQKGLILLESAMNKRNVDATLCLARCYIDGIGVQANATQAIRYALPLANRGNGYAQLMLGYAYDIQKDYANALSWYNKAAEQNIPEAQYQMSLHYRDGLGVAPNKDLAEEWYSKAIANGLKIER